MRVSRLTFSLFCVLLLSVATSVVMADETISATVLVLGQIENVESQSLFVVSREVGVPGPKDIVSVHELVQITRNADGTFTRTYREEPCVLWIDTNHDHRFEPNERRWKQPNDHACPIALIQGSLTLAVDDTAKTVRLDWHLPKPNRHGAPEVRTLEARAHTPFIERHTQLPGLEN